uniref:DBB domain-containing protein n=1 Tax=Strigamia maritima TaxID=126957 RepID=T1JJB0_STRMM
MAAPEGSHLIGFTWAKQSVAKGFQCLHITSPFSLSTLKQEVKGSRKMDAPDLTIVYAKDGVEWERYLDHCFRQLIPQSSNERPLHIHSEGLEHLSFPLSSHKVAFQRRAKAQLVILTPEFLDFVQTNPGTLVGQLLEPKRVIAMLCGVENNDVQATHRAELVSFPAWRQIAVKDKDKDFVLQLFQKTVEVMELSEGGLTTLKPQFKLTPRKVREGSNKIFALLENPILRDQDVKVYITGNKGPAREIANKMRNPYIVQFVIPVFQEILKDRVMLSSHLAEIPAENFLLQKILSAENIMGLKIQYNIMMQISQIVTVQLFCNGISLGSRQIKCESQMGELNQLLKNVNDPMAFLSQTLGLSGCRIKDLDNLLVKTFCKNLPPKGFELLDCSKETQQRKSEEEMPSLLHFAAFYGLKELCSCLLDLPNAKIVCNIRNSENATPAELAESAGHKDLAQMLENYTNLTATADLYSFGLSASDNTTHNETYALYAWCVTLLATAVRVLFVTSQLVFTMLNAWVYVLTDYPNNIPLYDTPRAVSNYTEIEGNETYLPMNCSNPSLSNLLEPHKRLILGLDDEETCALSDTKTDIFNISSDDIPDAKEDNSRFQGYNPSQVELLEILGDFKKNKYSINEVEQLFEDWKTRQNNSFREKESELKDLRSKYEQIQQSAPDKGKKPLSLDRIMALLTKSSKKNTLKSKSVIQVQKRKENEYDESKHRPVSTLSNASLISTSSLRSSSSSERLSTASSSTYDSGAQSDSGDDILRKKDRMSATIKERISQFELSNNPPPLPASIAMKEREREIMDKVDELSTFEDDTYLMSSTSPDYVCPDPEFVYQSPSNIIRKIEVAAKPKTINSNKVPRPSEIAIEEPLYNNFSPIILNENDYYNLPPPPPKPAQIKPNLTPFKISSAAEDKQQKILDPYPHKQPLGLVASHVRKIELDDGNNEKLPPPVPPRPPIKEKPNEIFYAQPRPPFPGRPLPALPK